MSTHLTLMAMALSYSVAGQIIIEKSDDNPAAKKAKEYSNLKDPYGDPLPKGAIARLGSLRFQDPAGITAIAFSKDGSEIFVYG